MKLAVVYPWSSPFMYTAFVDATLKMRHPKGHEVKFFRGTGWCPAKRHLHGCEQALEWGADLICIIGSDQIHPSGMLEQLMHRWQQGYEVVTAFVPCRGYVAWQPMKPFQPMAWRFKTNNELGETDVKSIKQHVYKGMDETPGLMKIVTEEDANKDGMARCHFIGSGVLMFHRDHILSLKKPWFFETVEEEDQSRVASMDCKFVWRLQEEAGAIVWVDTTITVKHLQIFEIDDTYSERFKDWSIQGVGDPQICNFPVKEAK